MIEFGPQSSPENNIELSERARDFIRLFQSWKQAEDPKEKRRLLQEWYEQFLAIVEGQEKFIERESIESVEEVMSGRVRGRAYLIVASGSSGARIDFENQRYLVYYEPNSSDSYALPYYNNYIQTFGSERLDLLQSV